MRTADHLKAIGGRLDRLDAKLDERFAKVDEGFAKVDGRFAKVDERFAAMDGRFAKVDERFVVIDGRFAEVDRRFDEQRAHTSALFEASRADFNNLYDFVRAEAARTDARFDQFQTEFRTSFADVHRAITSLAARTRRAGGRRRR